MARRRGDVCAWHQSFPVAIYNPCVGCELERLTKEKEAVELLLEEAMRGLEWYRDEHPESDSQADDEFFERVRKEIGNW